MKHKNESFKKKVLIPVIMVLVISVLSISAINYKLLDSAVRTKTNKNLDIFTDSIVAQENHLDIILNSTKQTLNEKHIAIAKSIVYILENTPTNMTPEELKRLAEPLDILEINVVNADGILTNSNTEQFIGFDYKSTEDTEKYMSLVSGIKSELAEEPRISVADNDLCGAINHYIGVSRTGGQGFIQLGFNAEVIGRLKDEINIEMTIKETKLGNNGYGMVLTDGLITAHPNKDLLGKDISKEEWYKAVNYDNGFAWVNIDGAKYYAGYKNAYGNTVVGLVPETDFYKELNQALAETVIILILAIIIMGAVIYLILDRLIKPIKKLSEGMDKITKGNLNVPVAITTKDEIGQLSRDLAFMVEQFKSIYFEINSRVRDAADGKLEARVETSRYSGDWNSLMTGLNSLLDAIILPINEAASVLHKIAKGDFETRVEGNYNGEFAIIKDSVNKTAIGIKSYINAKLKAEHAAYESELAKERADAAREAVISSINYASKIQKNLLPPERVFREAFSDYSIIWEPRDIVGGDIYWLKNFAEGTVLCVCDCTGHGTPGALLTMLVATTFESTVNSSNCTDTAQIIWELEKRLVATLNVDVLKQTGGLRGLNINDGCDLAVLYIAKDGQVNISAANTQVFVCDGTKAVRLKGQKIRIGSGTLKSKEDIKIISIPANPGNKFYIASDGLYEQIGGKDKIPFGYDALEKIIFENHSEKQSVISNKIWQAFEDYRGTNLRRDDFELITFKPKQQ